MIVYIEHVTTGEKWVLFKLEEGLFLKDSAYRLKVQGVS